MAEPPESARRPFYTEYAWAFDLLIDRPVRKECRTIVTWLNERGVFPGAQVLDAGCGTGRYAVELARRGYVVHGIDLSSELIAVAKRSAGSLSHSVSFTVGDIQARLRSPRSSRTSARQALGPARYDVILCRGVLNDVVDDNSRQAVFAAFRSALRPGGVVILDVREWEATAERKAREPVFRKRVPTERGTLAFSSVTELDPENRRLIVTERHSLTKDDGHERVSDYVFVMRCWTRDEVDSSLRACGFGAIVYFGAYDPGVAAGTTDRLVAVAQLPPAA